jgi:phospholipid transport system substrate-binding protein
VIAGPGFDVVVFTLLLAVAPNPAIAAELSPEALVKNTSQEVIAAIKADKDMQAGDPQKLAELAEAKINRHLDFRRMTQSAMAKNWRAATPEQQERLTTGFKTLLVGTYSKALVAYRDRTIAYRTLRGDPANGEVTVRSELIQNGQHPLVIDYDLSNSPAGWRIFDIKVDGASLVVTYRDSFAGEVRNRGIDGLIAALDNKNLQNAGVVRSAASDSRRGGTDSN